MTSVEVAAQTQTPSETSAPTPEATKETPVESSKTPEVGKTPDQAPAPVEKKVEAPKEDQIAHKFSILSKRERALRERIKEIEAKEKDIAEKSKTFEDFSKDKIAWAQKNGISYDEWTKRILGGDKTPPEVHIQRLEEEIKKVRSEREEEKKQALQSQTQKEIESFVNNLSSHVKTNSEKYELISHEGQEGVATVYEYILGYHQEHNKLLSFDQACDDVENYLTEKALGLKKLKKFQDKPVDASPKPETEGSPKESLTQKSEGPTAVRPNTLTNQMSSQGGVPVKKKLSREESIARAAAMLRFTQN